MGFGQRAGKFNELGKVISIRPSSGTPMAVIESFQIQSSGQPASVIHARDPIFKPGTETVLESDALFFMPTESYDANGVPQYTQLVINDGFSNPLKVSEYNEYFTVTKPGTMSSAVSTSGISNFGRSTSAGIAPKATSVPQTYRREGLVEVFLTTSSDADAEVAYSDDGINWCSLSIVDTFINAAGGAFGVATQFKTFPKYLVGAGASRTVVVGHSAQYIAVNQIEATGSVSYNTSGIYRSKVVPFLRDQSGTQYFLKTNVTFTGASVNSSASENGTISGLFGGVTFPEGYNEFTDGDDPVYTATPDSSRFVVSLTVNGSAQSISNPATAETHTFTNVSGANSIEAVFGYKTVASKTGSDAAGQTISPTGDIYRAEGDSIDFTFSETPASITYDGITQTVSGTTFTLDGIIANADFVVTFT
jgi:hypothetical protein|tara:strand:+ start:231 stop:1493 length:1263 start_codon:yes stop_codon:yes gene_type:complete